MPCFFLPRSKVSLTVAAVVLLISLAIPDECHSCPTPLVISKPPVTSRLPVTSRPHSSTSGIAPVVSRSADSQEIEALTEKCDALAMMIEQQKEETDATLAAQAMMNEQQLMKLVEQQKHETAAKLAARVMMNEQQLMKLIEQQKQETAADLDTVKGQLAAQEMMNEQQVAMNEAVAVELDDLKVKFDTVEGQLAAQGMMNEAVNAELDTVKEQLVTQGKINEQQVTMNKAVNAELDTAKVKLDTVEGQLAAQVTMNEAVNAELDTVKGHLAAQTAATEALRGRFGRIDKSFAVRSYAKRIENNILRQLGSKNSNCGKFKFRRIYQFLDRFVGA